MTLSELQDEGRRGIQEFRDEWRSVTFPYWQGPERRISSEMLEKDMKVHQMTTIYKDGVSYYRIWGMSAYVLQYFMSNILKQVQSSSITSNKL